ncbi:MAG TPA: hypothetical protein IAA34_04190 [Candidatus Enterococcus stercoripullorum]|nr:hypothetical protein [Candidatus Enterococcus stercoripullorum]
MLKIGVLGLGSIAQKAYLPVYVKSNQRATFVYATRNQEVQAQLMAKYHLPQIYDTLDDSPMDMFAGTNQENYQITTKNGTYHLKNLTEMTQYNQFGETVTGFNDWQTTLEKRGFEQAVNQFIDLLEQGNFQYVQEKSLLSHELCAQMLNND